VSAVYLDWNATTPPHPLVVRAMADALADGWANPASVHGPGRRARARLDDARDAVARLSGFHARDVILTSGGTEANNLALASAFPAHEGLLVVSRLEHPSIVRVAEALARRGVRVAWVAPEPSGRAEAAAFEEALRADAGPGPRLVALQAVNHETGVLQPVAEVAAVARAHGARMHVDAIQALGRLPHASWEGADSLALAAHKLRGPKGIGALVTRPGLAITPLVFGGAQERGLRPGTQDPIAAAGLAVAADRARGGPERYVALAPLRDRLEAELVALAAHASAVALRNGDAARAPHVTNLSFLGWRGDELAAALDLEGVAVSSGSACSAGTAEPSPVVTAMLGAARAASALRISLGEDTTESDLERAISACGRVLARRAGPSIR
jgi:cysteine desulfurase